QPTGPVGQFRVRHRAVSGDQGYTAGGRPGPALDPRANADVSHSRTRSHADPPRRHPPGGGRDIGSRTATVRVDNLGQYMVKPDYGWAKSGAVGRPVQPRRGREPAI